MATDSLYKRIGGGSAVAATVVKMYDKILKDELLIPFFENVDVETLRRSQVAFVSMAFGGPHKPTSNLRTVHAPLVARGLNDTHFDRVAYHLKSSLIELGVERPIIDEALAIIESTRPNILNK